MEDVKDSAGATGEAGGSQVVPQETELREKLGKLPAKTSPKTLLFARFAAPRKALPAASKFWSKRTKFPLRTFGNTEWGSCTRSSQAALAMRMERIEQHRTPIITDEEVVRVYREMICEKYQACGATDDTGAYEEDALSAWRRPEKTFRDSKGRPMTIDAFVRINVIDKEEIKNAIFTAGAHGIKLCFALPTHWSRLKPPAVWDVKKVERDGKLITDLTGDAMPGSWGGHSMCAIDFDEIGIWIVHTWGIANQHVTWDAVAAYCDEAHLVIDSVNSWKKKPQIKRYLDLPGLVTAVNKTSDFKIQV